MESAPFTACTSHPTPEPTLSSAQEEEAKTNFTVMSVALLVSVGLMGLKMSGYWITGSFPDAECAEYLTEDFISHFLTG